MARLVMRVGYPDEQPYGADPADFASGKAFPV